MSVLSIDPGRGAKPTIGYCVFTPEGVEVERGEMDWNDLCSSLWAERYGLEFSRSNPLRQWVISRVVIEDFVNDPRVKRGGQRNGTSEVIGAIEFASAQGGAEFVRRDRNTLTAAKMHAGYTQTLKHLPHQDSAFVHGYSDFVMRGILPAVGVDGTL